MSQTTNQESIPTIFVSPGAQERFIDQILIQSGGIGLGIFLSLVSFVFIIKYLGAGTLINKLLITLERSAESLNNLTNSIYKVSQNLDLNDQKYVKYHTDLMEQIKEIKSIVEKK